MTQTSLNDIIELKIDAVLEKVDFNHLGGDLLHFLQSSVEKTIIESVLKRTHGNQLKSSEILGINRNTLRKKIATLNIDLKNIKENYNERNYPEKHRQAK